MKTETRALIAFIIFGLALLIVGVKITYDQQIDEIKKVHRERVNYLESQIEVRDSVNERNKVIIDNLYNTIRNTYKKH